MHEAIKDKMIGTTKLTFYTKKEKGNKDKVYLLATPLLNEFNKHSNNFTRAQKTKDKCDEILRLNPELVYYNDKGETNDKDKYSKIITVITKKKQEFIGTWIHELLIDTFLMWLDENLYKSYIATIDKSIILPKTELDYQIELVRLATLGRVGTIQEYTVEDVTGSTRRLDLVFHYLNDKVYIIELKKKPVSINDIVEKIKSNYITIVKQEFVDNYVFAFTSPNGIDESAKHFISQINNVCYIEFSEIVGLLYEQFKLYHKNFMYRNEVKNSLPLITPFLINESVL